MHHLNRRSVVLAGLSGVATLPVAAATGQPLQGAGGVVLRSAHPFHETIDLLERDIAAKQIMMFADIDQADLAAEAGIKLMAHWWKNTGKTTVVLLSADLLHNMPGMDEHMM